MLVRFQPTPYGVVAIGCSPSSIYILNFNQKGNLDKPVKIDEKFIMILDKEAERLGFSRQRLVNNILRFGLTYLQKKGYEALIKLSETEPDGT